MKHDAAKAIAEKWIRYLSPACERLEIAGSIRRGKAEPKDIEIVCQPKIIQEKDLFDNYSSEINLLEQMVTKLFWDGAYLAMTKKGPRYKQLALVDGIKLGLFIVRPPSSWGVQFMIRTGPADFSHWMVTSKRAGGALPSYLRVKDGAVWHGEKKIEVPEESDYFRLAGMEYIEPCQRVPQWRVMG